jgi:phosphotransferase system enzyme I (PtsI)
MSEIGESSPPNLETRLLGTPASPGVAIGPILVLRPDELVVRRRKIKPQDLPNEIIRLEQALVQTREQILEIKEELASKLGEHDAVIFDAHLLVVEDSTIIEAVKEQLWEKQYCVEYIYQTITKSFAKQMLAIDDSYLRERANDIVDVSKRVLRNLMGVQVGQIVQLETPSLIVAHDLTPSDTVTLDRKSVLGFITEVGSRTSHTAIMARSLNIPAIVGLRDALDKIESGSEALIDGHSGELILFPSETTKYTYGQQESKREKVNEGLEVLRETFAITSDQRRVIVSANMELAEDLPLVQENGAEGIGLYRTEVLYLNRVELPNEEEQTAAYQHVARAVKPNSVIIRTLDVGGDKVVTNLSVEPELNPFLGWRGIRFCLDQIDLFKTQLRAICRASVEGNVRVMFPMITEVQEVRRARALLREVQDSLRSEGVPLPEKMETGIMIEVPSAALTADALAKEVDFFSIGTNDLIQYTLAVDRVNERVANLYQPAHPAIVRLIQRVVEAAHSNNIWVGVCGEMAGDVLLTPMLLGLGVDELSTGAIFVPRIKSVIQRLSYADMQQLAQQLCANHTTEENVRALEELAQRVFPELLQ